MGADLEKQNAQGRYRVLCVDDYPDTADSAVTLLQIVGFEAMACYSGAMALTIARSFRPHVCLIDLNMPDMAGDELANRLLAIPELQPLLLVAVTAMSGYDSRERIEMARFHLHLVKPVNPHKLIEVVDSLFQLRETGGLKTQFITASG